MAWISFGALPCRKKINLMTARVSMLLKSRPSLTRFWARFLSGRAKDLSAPWYMILLARFQTCLFFPPHVDINTTPTAVPTNNVHCVQCSSARPLRERPHSARHSSTWATAGCVTLLHTHETLCVCKSRSRFTWLTTCRRVACEMDSSESTKWACLNIIGLDNHLYCNPAGLTAVSSLHTDPQQGVGVPLSPAIRVLGSNTGTLLNVCQKSEIFTQYHRQSLYALTTTVKARQLIWTGYLARLLKPRGTAVAQWLRCCATSRKVAGSMPDGVIGIFHWHNPSDRTMALGSTQPLTEMSTRSISWG